MKNSRLYSFIAPQKNLALTFFDALNFSKEILELKKDLGKEAKQFYLKMLTSLQPLIKFTKPGERIAIYLDCEQPNFQFKLETGHLGKTRCLIFPDHFKNFPPLLSGKVRHFKHHPQSKTPYSSIIEVDKVTPQEIIEKMFGQSFQLPVKTHTNI